tara:strand:- start:788 stop:1207 length:420 start_codon:yes stop_codon:yes gene_type:complete
LSSHAAAAHVRVLPFAKHILDKQSNPEKQVFEALHNGCKGQAVFPQSISDSFGFLTLSLHDAFVQMLLLQAKEEQSAPVRQGDNAAQVFSQTSPPASIQVSSWFKIPSLHDATAHVLETELQTPLTQSSLIEHVCPCIH